MNHRFFDVARCGVLVTLLLLPAFAHAHGGEDHSHGEAAPATTRTMLPRAEAQTRDLEVLAVLDGDTLRIWVDRYATGEPVTGAQVEIDSGERRLPAQAADDGSYVASADWLAVPGERALVFTVIAPEVSDLLLATLEVPPPAPAAPAPDTGRVPGNWLPWAGAAAGLLLVLGLGRSLLRRRSVAAAWLLALAGVVLAPPQPARAHGGEDHGASAPALPSAGGQGPVRMADGSVFVPKPAQRLLGLRTLLAAGAEVGRTVELKAHVVPDPNASGKVQAAQAGRVLPGRGGLPHLGQKVGKGQVLAWLEPVVSTLERGSQRAQISEVEGQLEIARRRAARLEQLEGSVPRKEIEAARAEAGSLARRRDALAASLSGREALRAPVSGVISSVLVGSGQVLDARETAFEIVDPQRLMLEAVAYDLALAGRIASASAQGPDGSTMQLEFVGAGWQLKEQAVPLHFRVRPPVPPMSVGQPVSLFVQSTDMVKGVLLPRDAVLRAGSGESVVWVKESAERFAPKPVRAEAVDAARMVVTSGLEAGARVVTSGASLLAQVR